MSNMMKLVNAAAGQVVGDQILYMSQTSHTSSSGGQQRLNSINVDTGNVTLGQNTFNFYSDTMNETTGVGQNIFLPSHGNYGTGLVSTYWSYPYLDEDGSYYIGSSTNLASTHNLRDAVYNHIEGHQLTTILMKFNSKTLTGEPGYFYDLFAPSDDGNMTSYIDNIGIHSPSNSIAVGGYSTVSGTYYGSNVTTHSSPTQTLRVTSWPSTGVNAFKSGFYNSSSNPTGVNYGPFAKTGNLVTSPTDHTTTTMSSSYFATSFVTNGTDQFGASVAPHSNDQALTFRYAYSSEPYYSDYPHSASAGGTYSPNSIYYSTAYSGNTNASPALNQNFGDYFPALSAPENPFTNMSGVSLPPNNYGIIGGHAPNAYQWGTYYNTTGSGNQPLGIMRVFYRPGNKNNNVPGMYYILDLNRNVWMCPEDTGWPQYLGSFSNNRYSGNNMLRSFVTSGSVNGGLLIAYYNGGQNPSGGYQEKTVGFMDLDNRVGGIQGGGAGGNPLYYPNGGTALNTWPGPSYLSQSQNPNDKPIEKIVQVASGRLFGITGYENPQTMGNTYGGFRIHELFISAADPNNHFARSITWGNSYVIDQGYQAAPIIKTTIGNMPNPKQQHADFTSIARTRWLDYGRNFIKDVPTDIIYLRENETIYAINPNTRTNVTSINFANNPSSDSNGNSLTQIIHDNHVQQSGGYLSFDAGGENASATNNDAVPENERYKTFDMIFGDDGRVYLALTARQNQHSGSNLDYALVRFYTGTAGDKLQIGYSGSWANQGVSRHNDNNQENYSELYWINLITNFGGSPGTNQDSISGRSYYVNGSGYPHYWNHVNLMFDNKRCSVFAVARRDYSREAGADSTGWAGYSCITAVAVSDSYNTPIAGYQGSRGYRWPGGSNSTVRADYNTGHGGRTYGKLGQVHTNTNGSTITTMFNDIKNSATSDNPNGHERNGFVAGEARNITQNGKTAIGNEYSYAPGNNYPAHYSPDTHSDNSSPFAGMKGPQMYFSGSELDATQFTVNTSLMNSPVTSSNGSWSKGTNRFGALPKDLRQSSTTPFYGDVNLRHWPHALQGNSTYGSGGYPQFYSLYHAELNLKQTSSGGANNEEGLKCVWYYKGAFHGVTTYNEGTYVYMPEPSHIRENSNSNNITHYVSQCESAVASSNNVINGQNTKIGTAEGCENADWAACLAPGGILCIPKQDSGYNNAGFLTINLGTRQIINTNGNSPPLLGGEPFVAPSSLNPNGRQIKQMIVTSTGKIWAILDYEDPSASTLQFRILQVVFNSNYSSVTWSGGLYTSQANNTLSGHTRHVRTVCGNMPQSRMEWDAV
tara:strand:+ start:25611 stop:29555 length:3945 start_codon:yes stop_codon:yes gene_type:complete